MELETKNSTDSEIIPSLTHITTEFKNVLGILENGFKYSYLREDLPFQGIPGSPYSYRGIINYYKESHAVCFCDIPIKYIDEHMNQYGEYGIGISKEWCMSQGVTPIRYFHYDTPDLQDVRLFNAMFMYKALKEGREPIEEMINMLRFSGVINMDFGQEDIDKLPQDVKEILSTLNREYISSMQYITSQMDYLRDYEGKWIDRITKQKTTRTFYYEHEWRAIQPNNKTEFLTFPIDQVAYIIVKTEEEKVEIIKSHKEIKSKVFLISELKELQK